MPNMRQAEVCFNKLQMDVEYNVLQSGQANLVNDTVGYLVDC